MIDDGVARAHPDLIRSLQSYAVAHAESLVLADEPLVEPGGERCKNDPALVVRLHERMAQLGIDRQSFCVVIGGGAVQDMAGFAAATCHRGVRVVRLPTTVLGQNDSGVGVKNGVNAFGLKNFVGSFAVPFAVINDFDFLRTLSRRDRVAGMAEAVKVALIRDARFFEWLCAHAGELARAEFWTGLRPATPDGTPLVGATPLGNLFLNTGHGTLGWTMACGSGRLLADLLARKRPQIRTDGLDLFRYTGGGSRASGTGEPLSAH